MQKNETEMYVGHGGRKLDRSSRDYWRNQPTDLRRNQQEIDAEMQRKRGELAAEEKSFYEVCNWMEELAGCLYPGILSPQAVKLILAIKNSIRTQQRYYNMDMIVEYARRKKNSYIITDLMDKVNLNRVFLKDIAYDREILLTQGEYDYMRSIFELVEYERGLYDEDTDRLRKLKEILEIMSFGSCCPGRTRNLSRHTVVCRPPQDTAGGKDCRPGEARSKYQTGMPVR